MSDVMFASGDPGVTAPLDTRTPEQWRDRLLLELANRVGITELYERYYDGDHPLPTPPRSMSASTFREARKTFLSLSRMGITNYVKLVADAPAERLRVVGFRSGDESGDDSAAWKIWQQNDLDADSAVLHHSAIVTGNAFALVWPNDDGSQITVEHGGQAIVAYAAGSRRKRAAGLKTWVEDDGSARVVLYLPDSVFKWSKRKGKDAILQPWQPPGDNSWPLDNPFDPVIPLVEFRANPSLRPALFGGGRSDFSGVLPIQDRINKTIFDRLVTAEFQAFRQRWATGWTPDDPNKAMQASMRHLLTFEDADVKVGEFSQADFTGFIKAVESDVQAMAAITRTPSFYTLGQISNISGDALMALQSGLVARAVAHRDNFTESWEEVMRLAMQGAGNAAGASDQSSSMLWADIEHVTWAEIADALMKLSTIGVPREALWARVPETTPQDIDRWKIMAADQALFAPQSPPMTGVQPGPGQSPVVVPPGTAANGRPAAQ